MDFKRFYDADAEERKVRALDAKNRRTGVPSGPMDKRSSKSSNISINPDDLPESGKENKMK